MTKPISELKETVKKMEVLKERIKNGYIWLTENPNNSHYKEALDLYESLVDEAAKLGITEKECWPPTPEEQDEIFLGKPPEQSKLIA